MQRQGKLGSVVYPQGSSIRRAGILTWVMGWVWGTITEAPVGTEVGRAKQHCPPVVRSSVGFHCL